MTKEHRRAVAVPPEVIDRRIYLIRRQRVMPDADLAGLYRVETKTLNRAVKRNRDRFPKDFMFLVTTLAAGATSPTLSASKVSRCYRAS